MHKKLRTINNKPMTKIMPPVDNYISWQNTIEKNEDLWVPSVDTERGVNQYQVQFKNFFQIILKPFNYIQ